MPCRCARTRRRTQSLPVPQPTHAGRSLTCPDHYLRTQQPPKSKAKTSKPRTSKPTAESDEGVQDQVHADSVGRWSLSRREICIFVLWGLINTALTTFAINPVFAIIAIFVKDSPKSRRERKVDRMRAYKHAKDEHVLQGLFRIIKKPQAWLIALYGMFMYVPLTIIGVAWGGPYLTTLYGEETLALSIVGVMFIGAALGSPFFTFLSDHLVKRRTPMFIGASAAPMLRKGTTLARRI